MASSSTPPVPPTVVDEKKKPAATASSSTASLSQSLSSLALAGDASAAPILFYHPAAPPALSRLLLGATKLTLTLTATDASKPPHHPYLFAPTAGSISGDYSIARYLCRTHQSPAQGAKQTLSLSSLLCLHDPWLASQVDQWVDHCLMATSSADPAAAVCNLTSILETHLQDKTYSVGSSLSLADLALHLLLKDKQSPAVARWGALVGAQMPKCTSATARRRC